jgi:hypothetical protein
VNLKGFTQQLYYMGDHILKNMGHGQVHTGFSWEIQRKMGHFEDIVVESRKIIK